MMCLRTAFHTPSSSGSSVMDTNPKTKHGFHADAMFLFTFWNLTQQTLYVSRITNYHIKLQDAVCSNATGVYMSEVCMAAILISLVVQDLKVVHDFHTKFRENSAIDWKVFGSTTHRHDTVKLRIPYEIRKTDRKRKDRKSHKGSK